MNHCNIRNRVLNQKLRIRNQMPVRNCAARIRNERIGNQHVSETGGAYQKPGVWKLARELGSNAGVVRREHPWLNHDNGMV